MLSFPSLKTVSLYKGEKCFSGKNALGGSIKQCSGGMVPRMAQMSINSDSLAVVYLHELNKATEDSFSMEEALEFLVCQ